MDKKFSIEFKQQSVDYALFNAYLLLEKNKELKMANEMLKRCMCILSTIQVDKVPLYEKTVIPLPDKFSLPVT